MGKIVGLSGRQVRAWETDAVETYDAATLQKWAVATSKTVDYFLEPPAIDPPAQHHPGVEALLADAEECARWNITDDEAADLRAMILARPVMTLARARAYLLLQRAPD